MGVLLNLTQEYFGVTKREEDMTDFDKYMKDVEWVDLGHPKYLFSKKDFLKRPDIYEKYGQITKKDLFSALDIEEIQKNLEDYPDCSFLGKQTFWWLLKKNDFELIKNAKGDYVKIVVTKPGTDISVDLYVEWICSKVTYVYACRRLGYQDALFCDYYKFSPTIEKKNIDITPKSGKQYEHIPKNNENYFLFKLVKNKQKKTK